MIETLIETTDRVMKGVPVTAAGYWNRLPESEREQIIRRVEPGNGMATSQAKLPLCLQSWMVNLAVENEASQ